MGFSYLGRLRDGALQSAARPNSPARSQEHNFHPAYRPDIDGLRAVAILSVVFFHAFPEYVPGGFVGVDVFFVISGFLISSIIFNSLRLGSFSFAEFYAHRVKRIFPALILVLATSYLCGWLALLPEEFMQLGKHMASGAGFVQNFMLWKEAGYFDTASELKPLMHLWSLSIEEQFYIVYPLIVWWGWRRGWPILGLISSLLALSFVMNVAWVEDDAIKTFFLPHTRFWELLAGGTLAYWLFSRAQEGKLRHWRASRLGDILSASGLALILIAVFALDRTAAFPGWRAALPVGGAFLLILGGSGAWPNRMILANRFMVFVGLISYPLYLWHWPLLSFLRIFEMDVPSLAARLGAVALSFLLAWLTYATIERPIRFGKNNGKKTAALCILAALIGLLGYNAFRRDGWESRIRQDGLPAAKVIYRETPCRDDHPLLQGKPSYLGCVGDIDAAHVALIGDSHGDHLYAGIVQLYEGKPNGVISIGGGGCLPFYGVDSGDRKQGRTIAQCPAETVDFALQLAERDDRIDTVILASRGPYYTTGRGFGASETSTDRYIAWRQAPEIADFAEIFREAMHSTLERLTAKGKRVIYVLDVPELEFDVKYCNETRLPIGQTHRVKTPCAVSKDAFDARARRYREIASSVLADFPTVQVFDAAAVMCDRQYCWAKTGSDILYVDNNHLSPEGARRVAADLAKMVDLSRRDRGKFAPAS